MALRPNCAEFVFAGLIHAQITGPTQGKTVARNGFYYFRILHFPIEVAARLDPGKLRRAFEAIIAEIFGEQALFAAVLLGPKHVRGYRCSPTCDVRAAQSETNR